MPSLVANGTDANEIFYACAGSTLGCTFEREKRLCNEVTKNDVTTARFRVFKGIYNVAVINLS